MLSTLLSRGETTVWKLLSKLLPHFSKNYHYNIMGINYLGIRFRAKKKRLDSEYKGEAVTVSQSFLPSLKKLFLVNRTIRLFRARSCLFLKGCEICGRLYFLWDIHRSWDGFLDFDNSYLSSKFNYERSVTPI